MPSDVLAHQDPGADTSHNEELSRSEWHARDPNGILGENGPVLGCLRFVSCDARGGADASGLVVLAAIGIGLRRRRVPRRRN
jgi:hypothetical protein